MAVFGDDCRWSNESLKRDLLGVKRGAAKCGKECRAEESRERFHGRG